MAEFVQILIGEEGIDIDEKTELTIYGEKYLRTCTCTAVKSPVPN